MQASCLSEVSSRTTHTLQSNLNLYFKLTQAIRLKPVLRLRPFFLPTQIVIFRRTRLDGILNLNKPPGLTSHDVVAKIRKCLKIKRVGHAGSLDPQASGVLIILLGKATKWSNAFLNQDKEYIAEMRLGVKTDTQDAWGRVIEEKEVVNVDREGVECILSCFRGHIYQVPPMVSAVHYQGIRLYKLARQGKVVDRPARPVYVSELELLDFHESRLRLRVVCSSGTYIRTLCHDIGESLGVGGHLTSLVRTRVGHFHLQQAQILKEIEEKGCSVDTLNDCCPI